MPVPTSLAIDLKARLQNTDQKIVLAESCTAGMVAATMAGVPGISEFLCGSFVTYRESAKQAWLSVSDSDLAQHTAVSTVVTEAMAEGALRRTAEADLAVAVTGHLGPNAPAELDGVVYVASCQRDKPPCCQKFELSASERSARQQEATRCVLEFAIALFN